MQLKPVPGEEARLEHSSWAHASVELLDGLLGGITAPWRTEGLTRTFAE